MSYFSYSLKIIYQQFFPFKQLFYTFLYYGKTVYNNCYTELKTSLSIVMKDLIINSLHQTAELIKSLPMSKTKTQTIFLDIKNISPNDLVNVLQKGGVSANLAWFGTKGDEGSEIPVVYYHITVPMTEKEVLFKLSVRFERIAFKAVYNCLTTTNGYKRKGCDSSLLKQFDGKALYTRYLEDDFDTLVRYYSLFFTTI